MSSPPRRSTTINVPTDPALPKRASHSMGEKARSSESMVRQRSKSTAIVKSKSARYSMNDGLDRNSRRSQIASGSKGGSRPSSIAGGKAGSRRATFAGGDPSGRASRRSGVGGEPLRGQSRRSGIDRPRNGSRTGSRASRIASAEDRKKSVPLIDPDEKNSTFRRMASLGKSIGAVKVDTKVTGATLQACELLGVTKKDLAKLRIRFDAADIDGSGDITREEFFKMMDETPTIFTNAVFNLIDVDNSDSITYNEMVHVLTTFCIFNQNDILYFIFQQFDKDGSGSLDEHEFIEMIADLNAPAMFPGNLQRAFEKFDTNSDGLIDFDEFKELNNRFPMLLFPVFRLQDKMQRRTLGEKRWTKILKAKAERERIEAYKLAHDGDLPPKQRKSRCLGIL